MRFKVFKVISVFLPNTLVMTIITYLAHLYLCYQAVWFGCDVGKHFHSKLGINDMKV